MIVQQAHQIYGDKWEVFFGYAWLQGRTEQWESAYLSSKKTCELAPWHPPVWKQRTWIEENLGLSEQAASSRSREDRLCQTIKKTRDAARETLLRKKIVD